jgi:hypothetical protein
MKKLLLISLCFQINFFPIFSQETSKHVERVRDLETHYEITNFDDMIETDYTKFNSNNIRFESGHLIEHHHASSYASLQIPNLGDATHYVVNRFPSNAPWARPDGEKHKYLSYRFMNGKLDGMQFVGSFQYNSLNSRHEWVKHEVAVINGNIVGHLLGINKKPLFDEWESEYIVDFNIFMRTFSDGYSYLKWLPEVFEQESYYDLEKMVKIFLNDYRAFNIEVNLHMSVDNEMTPFPPLWLEAEDFSINTTFEPLKDNMIAVAFGMNMNEILIKVDPSKWMQANAPTRWYILYHELGHDVFNLHHGQGGRMMFNYPTEIYDWDDFFDDRDFMFDYVMKKNYPKYVEPIFLRGF